jgi:hypothetical protein
MEQQREMPQFYLHISGVSKMRQPPIKLIYGHMLLGKRPRLSTLS